MAKTMTKPTTRKTRSNPIRTGRLAFICEPLSILAVKHAKSHAQYPNPAPAPTIPQAQRAPLDPQFLTVPAPCSIGFWEHPVATHSPQAGGSAAGHAALLRRQQNSSEFTWDYW